MPSSARLQPVSFDPTISHASSRIYYLLWRPRPSQPWQSEEHFSRSDAHNRYFSLLQRGYEAYLEKRDRLAMPG
jgi:hypothetical protein